MKDVSPSYTVDVLIGLKGAVGLQGAVSAFLHVYACLVHERFECIVDLIRNVRYLDDCSEIVLNGGRDDRLIHKSFPLSE
jgi:hypothetical protein